MPSISDDDLCSGCTKCTYKPGASSSCEHDFPGSPDQDGYIVRCAEFRPQPITMTPEQVQAAIAGLDLKTYKGWIAGAIALLKDKPVGTAIEDQGGYLALIDGGLCCLAGFSDGRTTYEMEDGHPVDGGEPDVSAWDDERCCWDGLESAEQNALTLTAPVFVTLTFVETSASPVAMSAEVAAHEAGEGEPATRRILKKPQAEAVYIAMCTLNKVGAKVDVTFGNPDDGIHVYEYKWPGSKNVYVYGMSMGVVMRDECYADQSAFAAAYGLNQL